MLGPAPGRTIVDGTLGTGGHAIRMLEAGARVIGVDWDEAALGVARERLAPFGARFTPVCANFAELPSLLDNEVPASVDGILLDLGVSSLQLDDASRGFSFRLDGPLDMRMSHRQTRTAADLLMDLGERELEEIFRRFGEERYARRIARALKRGSGRAGRPSPSVRRTDSRAAPRKTRELGEIVGHAVPRRPRQTHPATRVFQALRIAVNHELENLDRFLATLDRTLSPGGRVAILSYHSLEDRAVKRAFADSPVLRPLTRKPIRPTAAEVAANPRARSAKLRGAERLPS